MYVGIKVYRIGLKVYFDFNIQFWKYLSTDDLMYNISNFEVNYGSKFVIKRTTVFVIIKVLWEKSFCGFLIKLFLFTP